MTNSTDPNGRGPEPTPFQLFPHLDAATHSALKASIERWGVLVPVAKDQHGRVLDGHHRAAIADELGVKYSTLVHKVDNDDDAQRIAATLNTDRRHLDAAQRREIVKHLLLDTDADGVGRHSTRAIAKAVGVSPQQVVNDSAELSSSGQLPDKRKGLDGKVRPASKPKPTPTVFARDNQQAEKAQQALVTLGDQAPGRTLDTKRAERMAREKSADERRTEAAKEVATAPTGESIDLFCADFRELEIEAGTVDLIFTDPPYPAEFLPLWSDLGEWASTVLKPGGLMLAYSGQYHLDHVMSRLAAVGGIEYRWMFAVIHPGAHQQVHSRRVRCGWKPVLVFQRPGGDDPPTVDDFHTSQQSKDGHDWEQGVEPALFWIERLTTPGALVADPFLGSGTTAVACKNLSRRFIGCDIDPLHVQTATDRIQ